MIDVIRSNIRNKMLVIVAGAMSVILVTVFWGVSSLNRVIDDYSETVNNNVSYMTELAELNLTFKTQVQEWKNTLIRGKDIEQLNKYWGRFVKNGEVIQAQYQSLLRRMPSSHPSYNSLQAFADTYPPMLAAYKRGYDAYIASGKDISTGDRSVKGIDREPTQRLS